MNKTSEQERKQAVKLLNREEFIALYEALHGSLISYGMKICFDEDAVRDAIHEVFVTIWEKREKYAGITDLKPYLFRFLRNILIDHVKQNQWIDLKEDISLTPSQTNHANYFSLSEEDILIDKELQHEHKQYIKQVIQSLSPRQQEVFYLKFYDGLSNEEIADVTGIKYQSVRNVIFDGLKKIRELNLEIYILLLGNIFSRF